MNRRDLLLCSTPPGGSTLASDCACVPSSSGAFSVEGDVVVLTPRRGVPSALSPSGEGLRDPHGHVFKTLGGDP